MESVIGIQSDALPDAFPAPPPARLRFRLPQSVRRARFALLALLFWVASATIAHVIGSHVAVGSSAVSTEKCMRH